MSACTHGTFSVVREAEDVEGAACIVAFLAASAPPMILDQIERIYREWDLTVNGIFTAKIFCGR